LFRRQTTQGLVLEQALKAMGFVRSMYTAEGRLMAPCTFNTVGSPMERDALLSRLLKEFGELRVDSARWGGLGERGPTALRGRDFTRGTVWPPGGTIRN
jgi:hypothetical protein